MVVGGEEMLEVADKDCATHARLWRIGWSKTASATCRHNIAVLGPSGVLSEHIKPRRSGTQFATGARMSLPVPGAALPSTMWIYLERLHTSQDSLPHPLTLYDTVRASPFSSVRTLRSSGVFDLV